MLGSVDRLRGVSTAEALNTKFGTARFPHLLLSKDKDKGKDKDKDTTPATIPTPINRIERLSKPRPDLSTNRLGTIGVESM